MNKLTAEKCRQFIISMKSEQDRNQLSITGGYQLQALEIALPILEQQERDEGDWIEWGGGECPVPKGTLVDVRLRDGSTEISAYAWGQKDDVSREFRSSYAGWAFWLDEGDVSDIIAYRIIPERATNQNGEQ